MLIPNRGKQSAVLRANDLCCVGEPTLNAIFNVDTKHTLRAIALCQLGNNLYYTSSPSTVEISHDNYLIVVEPDRVLSRWDPVALALR